MKLGVIGWYGHSNYGDERMLYSIKTFFSDCELFITSGWGDARRRINELNKCDYILIGGGGLILRNISHQTNLIRGLKKPFGFIGVSIEAKHRSMKKFFEIIKKKADFILVRDRQSKIYLNNHYKVIVGPDLTFLYPFDVVSEINEEICGLNLRHWFYWKSELFGRYHNLMQRLDRRFPSLKNVYPFVKWEPTNVVEVVKKKFEETFPLPFYFESDVTNDFDILSRYFQDVPLQFSEELFTNIRYLVGMRYHSIVFATQCGIPFISLSYQPKNKTFCSDMGLKVLSVDIFKPDELDSKINYIKNHYISIRNHLITYRNKCVREIEYVLQRIKEYIV